MSHEARRGSLVALTVVLAGCSTSRNVAREDQPLTDMPRTAPSARELALRSIGPEPPAPHLNAALIRRFETPQPAETAAVSGHAYHGLGITTPTRFEPMAHVPASAVAAAAGPAAVAAAPEPASAPTSEAWVSGGPWRDWTGAAQAAADDDDDDYDDEDARPNDGQDPLRPRRRLELRVAATKFQFEGTRGTPPGGEYGTIPGPREDFRQVVTTLRLDLPTGFPKRWIIHGWTLATTIEVPFVSTDVPGPDSTDDREFGIGDASAQMLFIPTPPGFFEWGFGAKASFPTARMEQMGTGRWVMSPTLAFMWHPKWMRNDGFFGVTLRDSFDTGTSSDRAEVHYGTIQPQFQWNFPRGWFVATQPEIRVDFRNDDRWYVPANLMIGKMFGNRWLFSVDGQYAITNHLELAEWTVEARIAFFF